MQHKIYGFLRSMEKLLLSTKNPQQIEFLLYSYHLWAWVVITTRCSSSFSTRSLSHWRWTFSTFDKLIVGFSFNIWISSSTPPIFSRTKTMSSLTMEFFSNRFKKNNNIFKTNNKFKINKRQTSLTKWEKKRLKFF